MLEEKRCHVLFPPSFKFTFPWAEPLMRSFCARMKSDECRFLFGWRRMFMCEREMERNSIIYRKNGVCACVCLIVCLCVFACTHLWVYMYTISCVCVCVFEFNLWHDQVTVWLFSGPWNSSLDWKERYTLFSFSHGGERRGLAERNPLSCEDFLEAIKAIASTV